MRVEILGSGGAATIPRPGCACRACAAARRDGGRNVRTGPSVFVHGPNIVFDTPEEAKLQLERAGIDEIDACFYSHWHPDHTLGRRVWETRNGDFRTWPVEAKRPRVTDIYLPEQVARDHRVYLGGMAHLEFLRDRGWILIHELVDGETVAIGTTRIRPYRLTQSYVYGFELTDSGQRLLVVMDELKDWLPQDAEKGCQLVVLPMGICEHHPLTGERLIHEEHPILRYEATFAETLEIVDALQAGHVILHHIEEFDQLTYDDLTLVEAEQRSLGRAITFAWDGLQAEV